MSFYEAVQTYVDSLQKCNAHEDKPLIRAELDRANALLDVLRSKQRQANSQATVIESAMQSPSPMLPEIKGDIVETLSCIIKDDTIASISLIGEIAISKGIWNRDIYIKFNNMDILSTNDRVLEAVDIDAGVFRINGDWLRTSQAGTTGLVKYTVSHLPHIQCPILVTPVWQFKEAEREAICMVNLRPLIHVTYTLLKVCIRIGSDAHQIMSEPTGLYNKGNGTIQWDLPSLEKDQILILRYRTEQARDPAVRPPHVRVDFTSSQLLSRVSVEYGTSLASLQDLSLNMLTISGNYKAE